MATSTLNRRLLTAVFVGFLVPAFLVGLVLLALYSTGMSRDEPWLLLWVVAVGGMLTLVSLATAVRWVSQSVVRALREIEVGTELMTTVNPDHRLQVRTRDELQPLGDEINRLADQLRDARIGLERQVAQATRELQAERGKLSAILQTLGEGVLLATTDGRVVLANRAAQDLLASSLLGRSLFDFIDKEKVAHFLDRLRAGARTGGDSPVPVERFTLHPGRESVLQTAMTPFYEDQPSNGARGRGEARQIVGFVLVLRDVTATARLEEERRRTLTDIVQEFRNPLSSIRSLSESLLADPSVARGPGGRLLEAIHAGAVRLSERAKGMDQPAALGLAGAPWHFEEITIADLAAMSVRRLADGAGEIDLDARLDVFGETRVALPPLKVEASALSAAIAHMLVAVLERRDPAARAWLQPALRERVVWVEIGARGGAVVGELESLLDVPLDIGAARRLAVREVIQQHGAEVWAYADERSFGYRMSLPLAASGPEEVDKRGAVQRGMGTASAWHSPDQSRLQTRPYYDFSLMEEIESHLRPADGDRLLSELTYVVFDTETTGLRPEAGDRIVSIAGVKVRDGIVREGETFDALVNPGRPIPAKSIEFHGITDEMVADAPPIDIVLSDFLRFAESAVLVGDQVWFDLRCLRAETRRAGTSPVTLTHVALDTVLLSEVVHGALSEHWLDATATRLGVTVRGRHSALGDSLATAEIFVRLLELLQKRGIRTLGQAIDAARARQWTG